MLVGYDAFVPKSGVSSLGGVQRRGDPLGTGLPVTEGSVGPLGDRHVAYGLLAMTLCMRTARH